jgi:hypothetical protein
MSWYAGHIQRWLELISYLNKIKAPTSSPVSHVDLTMTVQEVDNASMGCFNENRFYFGNIVLTEF